MQHHEVLHTVQSLLQAHSAAVEQVRVLCMSPGRHWIHQQSCEALASIYRQALQKLTNMLAAPFLSTSFLNGPILQLRVQPALDMVLAAILRGKRFIESCRPPTSDRSINSPGGSLHVSSYRSHWRGSSSASASSASFAKSYSQTSFASTDGDALDVVPLSEAHTFVDDQFWLHRALLKGHVNDAINVHLHDLLIAFSAVGAAMEDSNAQYMPQIHVSRRSLASADLALQSPDLFWKEQNKLPHVLLVSAQQLDHVQEHDDAFLDSQLANAMNPRHTLVNDADTTLHQDVLAVNDVAQLAAFVKEKLRCAKQGLQAGIGPGFLDISRLEKIDAIHMDSFYTHVAVNKVMWLGREFALKVYKKGMKEIFLQEAEIHVRLHHPNVVHAIALFKGERRYGILIELMDENLKSFLQKHALRLRLQEKVNILLQIAEGMAYVHGQGVIHRDIKPSNVLVRSSMDLEASNILQLEVKVADFGESRSKSPDASSNFKSKKVGTTVYRAPEVLNDDPQSSNFTSTYKKSADVYSFAITCFELLAEKEPFHDTERQLLSERVIKGERPNLESISNAVCPPYLKHCLKVWWADDPKTRHSFTQICCILRHLYACLAGCGSDTAPMEQFPFLAWPFWRWKKAQDIAQEQLDQFEIRRTDDDWKDKGYLCESTRVNEIPYEMHVMNCAIKVAAADHDPGVSSVHNNLPNQNSTSHRSTPGKSFGQRLKEFCCFFAKIIPSTHEAFHDNIHWRNRGYGMIETNKRRANMCVETWKHFRKERHMRNIFPQQKEVARKRVQSGHTSRLSPMEREGFLATFTKDYGRAPTEQETEYILYCGYSALQEQHGKAYMVEVARQETEGQRRETERSGSSPYDGNNSANDESDTNDLSSERSYSDHDRNM